MLDAEFMPASPPLRIISTHPLYRLRGFLKGVVIAEIGAERFHGAGSPRYTAQKGIDGGGPVTEVEIGMQIYDALHASSGPFSKSTV